jgi:hypothetical protein
LPPRRSRQTHNRQADLRECGDRGDLFRASTDPASNWNIDPEPAVAFFIRIEPEKVRFAHQQLALEQAVGEGGNDLHPNRLSSAIRNLEALTELAMKNIGHRVGIDDDRDCLPLAPEQFPGIGDRVRSQPES